MLHHCVGIFLKTSRRGKYFANQINMISNEKFVCVCVVSIWKYYYKWVELELYIVIKGLCPQNHQLSNTLGMKIIFMDT